MSLGATPPGSALRALDPTAWGLPLSPENLRQTWSDALDALDRADLQSPLPGTPPARVLLIGSANVYTAALPWIAHLTGRGVPVRVKPARGQVQAITAMASCFPSVEVGVWAGGDELAERAATADVDGVIAFGGAAALSAIGARLPPGVAYAPFGPRFGVSIVDRIDARTVLDHALYDGHGCMSPAAIFAHEVDLDDLAALCAEAERRLPRGALDPIDAVSIRSRITLARALGAVRTPPEAPTWATLRLPTERFSPLALPRVLTVHLYDEPSEIARTLAPYLGLLGTIASDQPPILAEALVGARRCLPGQMQTPPADGEHEGIKVLELLWGASAPPSRAEVLPRTLGAPPPPGPR